VSVETIVISALLAVVVLITYAPARNFGFILLDDPQYVSANARVLDGISIDGIRWAFATTDFYWHPLTWMSHMLDVSVFGRSPGAFHIVNVVLHTLSSVVLFVTLSRITKAAAASAAAALLFGLHPLHVESVAWIAERKDVLSTFFWMLCLLLYSDYCRTPAKRKMSVIAVFFASGLLAKPMILTLPFVLLLLDFWPFRRTGSDWRRSLARLAIEKMPLFALSLLSIVATLVSQRGASAVVSVDALSVSERIGNAIVSYVLYIRDMVWPSRLAPFYPLSPPGPGEAGIALLLVVAISAIAVRLARSRPYLLVGWFWYLGTLAPVIGFVQAGDQGRADRFTYVPLIGLFIALSWLTRDLLARFNTPALLRTLSVALLAVALSLATRQQLMFWKNDLTLWARTVTVTSGNYRAENLYGVALTDSGRLDEGIAHYQSALRIWPENPEAHNNLGAARIDQGRYGDAVAEFEAAVRGKPNNLMFRYNLAAALDAAGRRADAIEQVKAGLAVDPSFPSLLKAAKAFGMSDASK
jgi:hypothetical protein